MPLFRYLLLLLLTPATLINAQWLNDVEAVYSWNRITEVKQGIGDAQRIVEAEFIRHNGEVSFGKGSATFGFIYQVSSIDLPIAINSATGYMLTAGYDFLLTRNLRTEVYGRYGLSSDSLDNRGFYAADTDLRLNLVLFSASGMGQLAGNSFFPSLYAGAIVNKYGRYQVVGGAGIWWNGLGIYLTGHRALNGVANPSQPGADADKTWANIENAAASASFSYEYHNAKVSLKKTHPFYNGGNDLVISGQYQFYFR